MKHLHIITLTACLFIWQNSLAQEGKNDSCFLVNLSPQLEITAANESIEGGSIWLHDNEYHIFTNRKYIQFIKNDSINNIQIHRGEATNPNLCGCIYYNSEFKEATVKSYLSIQKHTAIGIGQGNFPRVKYKLVNNNNNTNKFVYICRPESKSYQPKYENLIEIIGNKSGIKNDTIYIDKKDTCIQIKIKIPKYSLLSDIRDGSGAINIKLGSINNTPLEQRFTTIDIKTDRFKNSDSLKVTYLQMDSCGIYNQKHIQTYYVHSVHTSNPLDLSWIFLFAEIVSIIIIVLMVGYALYKCRKWLMCKIPKQSETTFASCPTTQEVADKTEPNSSSEIKEHVDNEIPKVEAEHKTETKPETETQSDELQRLKERNSKLEQEREELRQKIASLTSEQKQLDNNLKQSQESNCTLQKKLDSLRKQLGEKNVEIGENKQKIQQLTGEIDALNSLRDGLNDKIKVLTAERQTYTAGFEKQLAELEKQLEAKNKELGEKNSQLGDKDKELEEKDKQLESKNKELEEKNKELEEKGSEFEKQLAEKEAKFKDQLEAKNKELEEIKEQLNTDRAFIIEFFKTQIDKLDRNLGNMVNDCDQYSSVCPIVSQLIANVNGYADFKNRALEGIKSSDSIETVHKNLQSVLLSDFEYEQSWVNHLARLYAYSRVPGLQEIFGYYTNYDKDIREAFNILNNLANLFGITNITCPTLFDETFDDEKFNFKNTNLTLPELYPAYTSMLKPMVIYDMSRLGFKSGENIFKPTVAYCPNF